MAAIGISRVFTYGGKFLGYLVAVVLVGGVLVGGGAYLAATGGVSLTDPSIDSIGTYRAIAGAALVALGGLVSLAGLFGLAHKLVADAATVAVESAFASADGSPGVAETAQDAETEETDESAEPGEPAAADEGADTPRGEEDGTGTVTEAPQTDRPVDGTPSQEPPEPATNEPGPSHARTDATPATAGPSDRELASETDHGGQEITNAEAAGPTTPKGADPAGPEQTDSQSASGGVSAADDFVDESATDPDWTESEYATGTKPDEVDGSPEAPDRNEDGALPSTGDGTESDDAGRTEWTPPDPAEFEQSREPEDDAAVDSAPATSDENAATGDATDGRSEDKVRTWDDVRSASSGNGIEADQEPTDADEVTTLEGDATETTSQGDGVGVDRESTARDESTGVGEQPGDRSEVGGGDVADEADEDDDLTLADEGVTSFEVEGDDDPLGDRLSGGDN